MTAGRPADEPHINQISAHLLRADVVNPEDALVSVQALDRYELRPESGLSGRLYVKPGRPAPPPWQQFLGAVVDGSLDRYRNEHASAVLFVERGARTFALAFGFGRHLLEAEALEPDFGLKVAAGLVDADHMTTVDSRLVQSGQLQLRRQTGRGATTREMGIDVGREMLRALSGQVLDGALGSRISGSDALGLAGRTDVSTLLIRLDTFLDAYERKLYRQHFPVLDRWLAVSDKRRRAELETDLVGALARNLTNGWPSAYQRSSTGALLGSGSVAKRTTPDTRLRSWPTT